MEQRIELSCEGGAASISLRGAEWLGWSVDGRSLLWTPDGLNWNRTAPVLFPVCGWTRHGEARVGGRSYPLGLHGFASASRFELVENGADHATLRLKDSDATRVAYPFSFELCMNYRLEPRRLVVTGTVRNTGPDPMPYAFGLHPGFRWPLAGGGKGDNRILFDHAERLDVPVIAPGGLFSSRRSAVPVEGRELKLSDDLFVSEALCFLDVQSDGILFEGPDGGIRVEMQGFPHLVLWSRPGAPFLCIENWTGYGDPEGFAGDLFEKPSMIVLAPGEARSHRASYQAVD